jgi:DNA polymerase I
MKTDILLDSDVLLFQSLLVGQIDEMWDEDVVIRCCDLKECRDHYWRSVHELVDTIGTTMDRVYHCFTLGSMFRRTLDPNYKNGRAEKPVGYAAFRNELLGEPNCSVFKEIEADDIISITARNNLLEGRPYVVCSVDKDLRQVPGKHYWPWHPNPARVMTSVSVEEAEANFWRQALQGDSGDKVPGCPGVGEVTARKTLAGLDPMDATANWKAIVRAYEKANTPDPEADALLTARLVRLLRRGDYDPATGTVNLWEPPT